MSATIPPHHSTHLTELRAVPGRRRVAEPEPAACAAPTRGGAMRPAAPGTPPPGVRLCNTATHCMDDTFIYRVIQEESSIFWEVIVSVIVSKMFI
jgi:hypothetical protein